MRVSRAAPNRSWYGRNFALDCMASRAWDECTAGDTRRIGVLKPCLEAPQTGRQNRRSRMGGAPPRKAARHTPLGIRKSRSLKACGTSLRISDRRRFQCGVAPLRLEALIFPCKFSVAPMTKWAHPCANCVGFAMDWKPSMRHGIFGVPNIRAASVLNSWEKLMTFAVQCPDCQRGNDDPFEVMARGHVDWTHCCWCSQHFFFLIAECKSCEEESVFAWSAAPLPGEIKALRCRVCDSPIELFDEPTFYGHSRRG